MGATMIEWHWMLPLCVGGIVSLAMESLLHPRPRLWGRKPWTYLVHSGLWLLLFTLLLAIVQRPVFAALVVLGFWLTVILVGNAKEASLREPFVFMDFEYFTDAFKHPRLYLPFLGVGRVAGIALIVVGVITAALWAEWPLTAFIRAGVFWEGIGVSLALAMLLLWLGSRWAEKPSLHPYEDVRNMGFAPSLWCYGWVERQPITLPSARFFGETSFSGEEGASSAEIGLAHLVVVQSESFFDARRLWPWIQPEVFSDLDWARSMAYMSGRMHVPPWGANTIRTEFAFLSGWSPDSLGIHRFQPYRRLVRRPIPTLASYLRTRGYRTICIHPYPSNFYARDRIYPLLGFDAFLDIAEFASADRYGPYTSDASLAQKALEILKAAEQPTFLFIITMENHGPLHLETISDDERARILSQVPAMGGDELAIYLRHLRNAGHMLRTLIEGLDALSGPAALAFYGDHVPILEKLYAMNDFNDGCTDYWLWSSSRRPDVFREQELNVEDLGVRLLQLAGTRDVGDAGWKDRGLAN